MSHPVASVPGKAVRGWARFVSRETTGGALLIGAAVIAVVWANSPWRDVYFGLADITIGPSAPLHLDLSLATWAADGLLAIFFFTVGLELKHEFAVGSLRNPRKAAVPMLAAVGGMAVPAAIYAVLVIVLGEPSSLNGWAIPTATDIAFALAVLAVFGRGLPIAIRTFLLTLAVVDDLLAIVVIAVFYTDGLQPLWLLAGVALAALFGVVAHLRWGRWWLLLPLAVGAWVCIHESGVHATVAGVLVGLTAPAVAKWGESESRVHRWERLARPISSGIAVPVFAFFASGVAVIGVEAEGGGSVLVQPVVIAVAVALIVGKLVGVLGTTALVVRFTPLRLADTIGTRDLLPVGILAGIGFTVSLLIAELSFDDLAHLEGAKAAILGASIVSAILGAITLVRDARRKRSEDENEDGMPDTAGIMIGDDHSDELESPPARAGAEPRDDGRAR